LNSRYFSQKNTIELIHFTLGAKAYIFDDLCVRSRKRGERYHLL